MLRATAPCHFSTSGLQNRSEPDVFCTFWLAHVRRATAACRFFQIGTSKIAPKLRCFAYFDLQMCFAPQQRSFFRIGTSHSGVPFFTSPLSSYLCARRFSEPTFLNLRNHESLKKQATFLTFGGRGWSFFLDFLVTLLACWSSVQWPYLRVDLLSSASTRVLIFFLLTGLLYSAFQLSILSEVRLLNFLRLLPKYPPSRCTSNRRCAVFPAADCQSIFEFVSANHIVESNCEGSS